MAAMHTPAGAQGHQRVGLLLLLAGLVLAAGGFALPWLSVTCVAHCSYGPWAPTRGPIETDGLFFFAICGPAWLLALSLALLTALQEFLPAERRSAAPALLLAGMLLVLQAIALVFLEINISRPALPILTLGLLPESAVGPLGALLVADGGWLRYHRRRIATRPSSTGAPGVSLPWSNDSVPPPQQPVPVRTKAAIAAAQVAAVLWIVLGILVAGGVVLLVAEFAPSFARSFCPFAMIGTALMVAAALIASA